MRNKKVIASFKCVLAMLSCLMLGACRPQMAKSAMKVAGQVFSKSDGKAKLAAARIAAKGVVKPHFSGGDIARARNIGGSSVGVSQDYGNVRRAATYIWSQQNRENDESDQRNQRNYYW